MSIAHIRHGDSLTVVPLSSSSSFVVPSSSFVFRERGPRVLCDTHIDERSSVASSYSCSHLTGNKSCMWCYSSHEDTMESLAKRHLRCEDCAAASRREQERIQRDCTINPDQEYGVHVFVGCSKHPDSVWSTKNIDYIGARSLFPQGPVCGCHPDTVL